MKIKSGISGVISACKDFSPYMSIAFIRLTLFLNDCSISTPNRSHWLAIIVYLSM